MFLKLCLQARIAWHNGIEIFLELQWDYQMYTTLEIKPCRLGSRIRDMEAESYNWSHSLIGEHLNYLIFLLVSRTGTVGWSERCVQSLYGVWPLAASMEVKNNQAHFTTPMILYKFIEVTFSVGCMVWLWCCQFQDLTPMSLIYKMCFTKW